MNPEEPPSHGPQECWDACFLPPDALPVLPNGTAAAVLPSGSCQRRLTPSEVAEMKCVSGWQLCQSRAGSGATELDPRSQVLVSQGHSEGV